MYFKTIILGSLLAWFSPVVLGCEGECIVAITKAFVGNYSSPVHDVLRQLGEQVSTQLLPPSSRPTDPITLMQPLYTAYLNSSYDSMENAIFPSYFHGKCQRFSKDGQDPPGCPNPDCPVVCGTPGSLVHFYSTLRLIAFNDTKTVLENFAKPGSVPYAQVEALVRNAQTHTTRTTRDKKLFKTRKSNYRDGSIKEDSDSNVGIGHLHAHSLDHHRFGSSVTSHNAAYSRRARTPTTSGLTSILSKASTLLGSACGGTIDDSNSGLPKCSWEVEMKKYILSFP